MRPLENDARGQLRQLPVQVADFYSELGRCQRAEGETKIARLLFQRSLEVRRNTLDDTVGVVENLADLADLERDAGQTEAALEGFSNALAQLQASAGNRHPLAIGLRQRLCDLERNAGQLVLAERDCHDALSLALDLHGDDHPSTVNARRQLAAIHVDLGRFREAGDAYRSSQKWLIEHLGRKHEDVARDDNSLGIVAWELGDFDTALRHLDRALAVLRKDPGSWIYQGVLFNKGMVLHDAGRDQTALPLLLQVEKLRIASLGKDHERIGDTERMIGEVLAALGQNTAARLRLVNAVRLTRAGAGYGPSHPHTRRAELSLALFDLAHGDPPPPISNQLEQLAALPKSDPELRKVAWLASTAIANQRCLEPGFGGGPEMLDAIEAEIDAALPEGGAFVREFERLRSRCR
jgi:eukaryotic-like serine/threonine-protein kinase